MSEKKNKKARHWTFITYPDSAPDNWISIVQNTGCEIAISPLHNMDYNESTGEKKKEHYHVIISYPNTTTYNNVKSLCDEINAPIPQSINSVKGALRYLTHQDNPEKAQYDSKDIKLLNGFDLDEYNELTITQRYEIKMMIMNYIVDNNIIDYLDLCVALVGVNFDWWKVCVDNTLLFDKLCTSNWKKQRLSK